jgi:hypothetical protein
MALNSFFLQGSQGEQNLVQDLINEQLRMYGVEVHYLPRKYITEKTVIREVIQSTFDDAYPIEAYLENYDGYGDQTTILSKFGIQALNEITLTISKERYESYITPLLDGQSDIKLATRPKEGDLIYFPFGDRLFEIKFVEHEQPFYQLRKTYVYTLKCELFRYENEVIDTDVAEIDDILTGDSSGDIATTVGITQTLTMAGVGTGAAATVGYVSDGAISEIIITNRGGGYALIPRVAISSAPSSGITGIATATMIGGIVACEKNVDPINKSVQSVELINAGAGYTETPKVRFIAPPTGGTGAAATARLSDGVIGIVTITNGGSGYTTMTAPLVTFTGSSTVSAAATVVVSSAGTISQIRITNGGIGYTAAPTIALANPGVTGSGTYLFNEVVTGQTSGVTGRVVSWTSTNRTLKIGNLTGNFDTGESILGLESGASYKLSSFTQDESGFTANEEIEIAADAIMDFSEGNPFGTP